MALGNLISIGEHRNQLRRQFQPIDYNMLESFLICPSTYGRSVGRILYPDSILALTRAH